MYQKMHFSIIISCNPKSKEYVIAMITEQQKQYMYNKFKAQYDFLAQKQSDKIKEQYKKKLDRRYNKRLRTIEQKAKDKQRIEKAIKKGKPIEKKDKTKTLSRYKNEAFSIFQLYIRISKSNNKGFVVLLDNKNTVYYTECDAGHFYPKSNYPQLAFVVDNVFPISKYTNKAQ